MQVERVPVFETICLDRVSEYSTATAAEYTTGDEEQSSPETKTSCYWFAEDLNSEKSEGAEAIFKRASYSSISSRRTSVFRSSGFPTTEGQWEAVVEKNEKSRFTVGDFHRLPSFMWVDEERCETDASYRDAVEFLGLVGEDQFCEEVFNVDKNYRDAMNLLAGTPVSRKSFSQQCLVASSPYVLELQALATCGDLPEIAVWGALGPCSRSATTRLSDSSMSTMFYCELDNDHGMDRLLVLDARACGLAEQEEESFPMMMGIDDRETVQCNVTSCASLHCTVSLSLEAGIFDI